MLLKNKFKLIDCLFDHPIINLNNLVVSKIMNKRRNCTIIHCIDSITGDNYVCKKFKPLRFLSVR